MATKSFTVSKQMMALTGGAANPGDRHVPLGYWSALGSYGRALMYAPISFAGMTNINSAYLVFQIHNDDAPGDGFGAHVLSDAASVALGVRRKTADWSESSAGTPTTVDETWGGNGAALMNSNWVDAGDAGATGNAGAADGTTFSVDITETVRDWFAGSPNYGVMIYNVSSETGGGAGSTIEFYSRHSSGRQPYIVIDYGSNTTPLAPHTMSPADGTATHTGVVVNFSGYHNDFDVGDYMTACEIEVWNSSQQTRFNHFYQDSLSQSAFSVNLTMVAAGSDFYWRARTRDRAGVWGPFSPFLFFHNNTPPNTPSVSLRESPTTDVKTLSVGMYVTHNDVDNVDSGAHGYRVIVERVSDGAVVHDSGDQTLSGSGVILYGPPSSALTWGTQYRWKARTKDLYGAWGAYSAYQTFTTHSTAIPASLSPSGGTMVGGIVPTFTGSRGDGADSLTAAEIEVYDSTGSTLIWSSGVFSGGVTATGFSKAYGGTALQYDRTYKWRARVTASPAGTSAWSALQTFVTTPAGAVETDAPIGSGITDLTPAFEFSRTSAFNSYQIVLYAADGTTVLWDSGTVAAGSSVTSRTHNYPGTPALAWSTTYKWKVRVSSDGGTSWGDGYTDLVTFTTEMAGVPDSTAPSDNAWLGAPWHMVVGEVLTGITGSAQSTVTLDTTDFQQGASSIKASIASHPAGTSAVITLTTTALDLSDYGDKTDFILSLKFSSLTNVTGLRARIIDGAGAWAEYNVLPGAAGSWQTVTVVKGSPVATSGTIDWSDVVSVQFRLTTSATVSLTLWVDDFRVDATEPSFDGTSSGGETISTVRVIVYASDQTTEVWDSGEVAVGGTDFSVAYAGPTLTKGATYYWKARYTESTGPTGGYSALRAFSLNAAPSAPTGRTPSTGEVVKDDLTPDFTATYEDPDRTSAGDSPSLFEVEVYRNSDSVLMHTLRTTAGLTSGANTLTRTTEGTALSYEVEYKWRARYADSMGEYGAWSGYNVFKTSQSPTASVTAPGATISSPAFTFAWTFTSPGGKAQNRFRVLVIRDSDSVTVYDSGTVFSSTSSHAIPAGYLVNGTDYTIRLEAFDTDGLSTGFVDHAITSDWTAPDAITGFSGTIDGPRSRIVLNWDASTLASDFSYYQIYRRESGSATWVPYTTIRTQSVKEYEDIYAAHGVTYEYKITVWKTVVGDVDIESADSEIVSITLDTDVWFVIGADRSDTHSFELPVYDESHTEPIQQEVFEPLGSRRKSIVRGKVLGAEGSLQVQWTNDERPAAKAYLRYLADNAGPHILKSPFGDVWEVEFGGPAKKYSGGGHMGVTLTWIEVT